MSSNFKRTKMIKKEIDFSKYDIVGICPNNDFIFDDELRKKDNVPKICQSWLDKKSIEKYPQYYTGQYNVPWGKFDSVWCLWIEGGALQLLPEDKIIVLRPKKNGIT